MFLIPIKRKKEKNHAFTTSCSEAEDCFNFDYQTKFIICLNKSRQHVSKTKLFSHTNTKFSLNKKVGTPYKVWSCN